MAILVACGVVIGIVCNELSPAGHVSYFGFRKQDVLESRLAASVGNVQPAAETKPIAKPLEIAYFFAECEECEIVKQKVLPKIKQIFGGAVVIRQYDCGAGDADMANYKLLLEYEKRYGSTENQMLKMFVGDKHYLAGADQMVERAIPLISEVLAAR